MTDRPADPLLRFGDPSALPDPAAVIFDLDGTIVDTIPTRVRSWSEAMQTAGITPDARLVGLMMGRDGRHAARALFAAAGIDATDDDVEAVDAEAGERFSRYNLAPALLPGVKALIDALDAAGTIPWSIATSSRRSSIDSSIRALGLDRSPSVTDGTHVAHAKPAPDLLLLAAAELGIAPERCWYVGDAIWDQQASRAAGMIPVAVETGAADTDTLVREGAAVVWVTMPGVHAELARRGLVAPPSGGGTEEQAG